MGKLIYHHTVYEVGVDAEDKPNKLSRYDTSSKLYLSILFAGQKNPKLVEEIKHDLKDISIASLISSAGKK